MLAFLILWGLFALATPSVHPAGRRAGDAGQPGRRACSARRPDRLRRRQARLRAGRCAPRTGRSASRRCATRSSSTRCAGTPRDRLRARPTPVKLVVLRDGAAALRGHAALRGAAALTTRRGAEPAAGRMLVGLQFGQQASTSAPAEAAQLSVTDDVERHDDDRREHRQARSTTRRRATRSPASSAPTRRRASRFEFDTDAGDLRPRADLAVAGHHQPVPVPAARRRAHLLGAGREGPRPADLRSGSWSARRSSASCSCCSCSTSACPTTSGD